MRPIRRPKPSLPRIPFARGAGGPGPGGAASVLAALLAAACGGDGGPAATDTSSDPGTTADATIDGTPAGDAPVGELPAIDVPVDVAPDPVEGPFGTRVPTTAVALPELEGTVYVGRDAMGMPHIVASTFRDAFVANGYVHAVDRFVQMELFRRVANGELAELLGGVSASLIADDVVNRTLGFRRAAQAMIASFPEGSRELQALEGYAAGVNAWLRELREGSRKLPSPYAAFLKNVTFRDWTPADSLAVGRLQASTLGFNNDWEISNTRNMEKLKTWLDGLGQAATPELRAALERDLLGMQPADPTPSFEAYAPMIETNPTAARAAGGSAASGLPAGAAGLRPRTIRPRVPLPLLDRAARYFKKSPFLQSSGGRGASNNWAVGASLSASGHAMVCNDPHLALDNPPLFHLSRLQLLPTPGEGGEEGFDVRGASFPGIPGYLVGHNARVAWGVTTANYDRSDVFLEDFRVGDGGTPEVFHDGAWRALEVTEETVKVGNLGTPDREITFRVYRTPRGGVLVPQFQDDEPIDPTTGPQLSHLWVGFEPTDEFKTVIGNLYAKSVDDLIVSYQHFGVANQHVAVGDDQGNIAGMGPGLLPRRKAGATTWDPETNPDGTAPWWILPGDGSADWDGLLPGGEGVLVKNPAKGFVATANDDPLGHTFDGNPLNDGIYFGEDYSMGFRTGRISRLLDGTGAGSPAAGGAKLSLEDMLRIQSDTDSTLGRRLLPAMLQALELLDAERAAPGTHPALAPWVDDLVELEALAGEARALLQGWRFETPTAVEVSGGPTVGEDARDQSVATTIFNVWLSQLYQGFIGDETAAVGAGFYSLRNLRTLVLALENEPGRLYGLDPDTQESPLWDRVDTAGTKEGRDEIVVEAFFKALRLLPGLYAQETAEPSAWVWGALHRLVIASDLPVPDGLLDIPRAPSPHAGKGFPLPGDNHVVNICSPGYTDTNFTCGSGPVIRTCVELDPAGLRSYAMLPGGLAMDMTSPWYSNWAEGWVAAEPTWWPSSVDDVAAEITEYWVLRKAE